MKYGILWDLDGTLLDTLQDLCDGVNYALACHGLPQRSLAEVRRFVGNGAGKLIERAVAGAMDHRVVLETFRTYYNAHCREKTAPYPGIPEALAALGEKYPMAVVSNKPDTAVKPLCDHYFPGIYARGEGPDCPRKPAPDMVFQTIAALGVDSCLYVGDSEVDIQTARNAGVPCLSVLWGFRDQPELEAAGAAFFCDTTDHLTATIENILGEYHGK